MHLPKENKDGKVITLKQGGGRMAAELVAAEQGAAYGGERERESKRAG